MFRKAKPRCIACDSENNLIRSYSELGGHNFMVCKKCMEVEPKPKKKQPDVTTKASLSKGKK